LSGDHIANRTLYEFDGDLVAVYESNNLNPPLTRREPHSGYGRNAIAEPPPGRRVKGQYTSIASPTRYPCYDADGTPPNSRLRPCRGPEDALRPSHAKGEPPGERGAARPGRTAGVISGRSDRRPRPPAAL
jgi:hypothetical protein